MQVTCRPEDVLVSYVLETIQVPWDERGTEKNDDDFADGNKDHQRLNPHVSLHILTDDVTIRALVAADVHKLCIPGDIQNTLTSASDENNF